MFFKLRLGFLHHGEEIFSSKRLRNNDYLNTFFKKFKNMKSNSI